MRPFAGRRGRHLDAFTFIELLVILSILGVGVYFASVGTSGQNSYYGLRGDVERIVATLQRACIQSASRGDLILPSGAPVTAGVTFYVDQMSPGFAVQPGLSFVGWFDDLAPNPDAAPRPPATLGGSSLKIKMLSRALRAETILTRQYTPGPPGTPQIALTDGACFPYRRGRLDVFLANGTVGGVNLPSLAANFNQVNSGRGTGQPVAWCFDVVNQTAGWVRVRVLSGGFVEVSGINPLAIGAPTTVVGRPF